MPKTTRSNRILLLQLLCCLVLLLPQPAAALLKKGETLPELSGKSISGEPFSSSQLKGQPFIIKLGTTWCPTCGDQSKQLSELSDYLVEQKIKFVDVFIQQSEKKVRKYFDKKGYQTPDIIVLDSGKISRKLNVYVIPRLLLVDKNMQVFRDGANLSKAKLKQALEEMLAEN